jgi:hypothetical protein
MHHRQYNADFHNRFPGLNYAHHRPFRNWQSSHLETLINGWLMSNPPYLELATLALGELMVRGDDLAASMKFAELQLAPIPWLDDARKAVSEAFPGELLQREKKGRLGGNVYVVLRGGYTKDNGWYGAYVGSTKRSIEKRFREHRTSSRAGRGLIAHGIEPLYSLFSRLNPLPIARQDLLEWETRLHEALAPVIPKVTGDVAL